MKGKSAQPDELSWHVLVETERRRRAAEVAEREGLKEKYAEFDAFACQAFNVLTGHTLERSYATDAQFEHAGWFYGPARGDEPCNLLLHLPIRLLKTTIWIALGNAYRWTWDPGYSQLSVSHGAKYKEHSTLTRRLVLSDWYQSIWPMTMVEDENRADQFRTNLKGYRTSANFMSALEGLGGDDWVADDIQSFKDLASKARCAQQLEQFQNSLYDRVNDPRTAGRVYLTQRQAPFDLANMIRVAEPNNWYCLSLEGLKTPSKTIVYYRRQGGSVERLHLPKVDTPLTRKGLWEDPREDGEELSPRHTREEIEKRPRHVVAARIQQAPILVSAEGAKVYEFERNKHLLSFAERMGAGSLAQAVLLAKAQGWRFGAGGDWGQAARRTWVGTIAYSKAEREVWCLPAYTNTRRRTPLQDAMGYRDVLDGLSLEPTWLRDNRGDVGGLGRAAGVQSNIQINQVMERGKYPEGHPRAGQKVLGGFWMTADKRAGSVESGVELINRAFAGAVLFVDTGAEDFAIGCEQWDGSERDKDVVDAYRYRLVPALKEVMRE